MRTPLALFVALVTGAFSVGRAQCTPAVQKLLTDQKYDDARAEVQSLVKKNAADDVALQCMGRVYFAMDKSNEAIDWFEKAIKANEKVASHHLWLANSLGDQAGHTNKLKLPFLARRIKSEFDRAAQLDPSSIDARHGLIQFYSQAPGVMGGSMDKAKEQAIEIEKLNAMRGHIEMAALLEREKDLPGAERELTAALGAAPDSNQAYNTLGNFYRRQKRYADAVTVYERLLKAKPDAQGAHLNIGLILAQSGQSLDRAEHEVKQWLADAPKDAPLQNVGAAHYALGLVYEHQGKTAAAKTEYQAAITINPRNEEAKKALAALK